MALVANDVYTKLKAMNAKMSAEAREEHPNYLPFGNGDDYFAGKVAEAVSGALSAYTDGERTALDTLNAATAALSTALAGMTSTPYAPIAGALATWTGAFIAYIAAMKAVPDAPDTSVIP
jgi:hypothetical protein